MSDLTKAVNDRINATIDGALMELRSAWVSGADDNQLTGEMAIEQTQIYIAGLPVHPQALAIGMILKLNREVR